MLIVKLYYIQKTIRLQCFNVHSRGCVTVQRNVPLFKSNTFSQNATENLQKQTLHLLYMHKLCRGGNAKLVCKFPSKSWYMFNFIKKLHFEK
jgi:hypothetical protein